MLTDHLVKDCIGDHLFENAFITFSLSLQEELVAIRARYDIVDEYTDLVSKTFIILFVAATQNHFKWRLQRRHYFWVDCQLLDSLFTSDFNQVPECLDRQRYDIRTEVLGLADDSYEISADSFDDDVVSDRFVKADCSNGLEDRNHRVNARSAN